MECKCCQPNQRKPAAKEPTATKHDHHLSPCEENKPPRTVRAQVLYGLLLSDQVCYIRQSLTRA
ncbi:hypothetical protein EYF80_033982 [Liparis tanakae]|uniref:Uncharacterized protein n=1 Tax=Liparis tanakae TaxID=230148 RepID=A0A4Z2GRD9_9TELE|nr:hypothetical protein EYF80_033982 [Liparis tanakae]